MPIQYNSDEVTGMLMPRWVVLFVSFGFASPHFSIESIHFDIMRAKESGGRVLEVSIISTDSLRSVKRFSTGLPYSGERKDSTEGSHSIFKTWYLAKFNVIMEIAGQAHPKKVPLLAVDTRSYADHFWKKAWPPEKWSGKTFILVLEKNGQIRALYLAKTYYQGNDEIDQRKREFLARDISEELNKEQYKEFIHIKNLKKLLKREQLSSN